MAITTNLPLVLVLISLASPFGVPLGATLFIISAGSQSVTLEDYAFYVTLMFFGFVVGDVAAYAAASHFEKGIKHRLCRYDWVIKKYKDGEALINKYGLSGIFLSRFVLLGLGAPLNYLSGFSRYSFRKFFISAASGEFLYSSIYTYIGFVFKDTWISMVDIIVEFSYAILLFLAALFALYQLKRHL